MGSVTVRNGNHLNQELKKHMDNQKTVYIVDDEMEVCSGLQWLFESVHLPVETYQCAKTFLTHYNPARQGCLVLDVKMPGMSGIELMNHLKVEKSQLPTIIITGYGDLPMAVEALKVGAVDFIQKPIDEQYLLNAVRYHLEKITNHQQPSLSIGKSLLTKREQEIMGLIMSGKLNKEIAFELGISIATVEAHRSRIMHKYHAKNLAQLVMRYFNIPDNYHELSV